MSSWAIVPAAFFQHQQFQHCVIGKEIISMTARVCRSEQLQTGRKICKPFSTIASLQTSPPVRNCTADIILKVVHSNCHLEIAPSICQSSTFLYAAVQTHRSRGGKQAPFSPT